MAGPVAFSIPSWIWHCSRNWCEASRLQVIPTCGCPTTCGRVKRVVDARSQHQVRSELPPFDLAQAQNFCGCSRALARDGLSGVATAKNFRGIEERDALGEVIEKKRGVHLATTFDEQAGDLLFS